VNSRAADDPSLVNSDPMDAGWLFRIRFSQPSELSQLFTETDYQRLAQ